MGLEPIVPEGTYLADSRDTAGNKRALLFEIGTGKLIGPPELEERGDESSFETETPPAEDNTLTAEEVFEIVENLVRFGLWSAPHVKRLWVDKVSPALKGKAADLRDRIPQKGTMSARDGGEAQGPRLTRADARKWISMVNSAIEASGDRSGGEDAQRLCAGVLVGAAMLSQEMRRRSDSLGLNRSHYEDLNRAHQKLATVEFTRSLNRMLEAHGALLDEQELAAIEKIFGGGRVRGGKYAPLQTKRVVEALRLPTIHE